MGKCEKYSVVHMTLSQPPIIGVLEVRPALSNSHHYRRAEHCRAGAAVSSNLHIQPLRPAPQSFSVKAF
jgi:hypothetical protein